MNMIKERMQLDIGNELALKCVMNPLNVILYGDFGHVNAFESRTVS